ncbi:MAG: hypothetical protein Ct9H300mP1_27280 [Planctomycetaceae bacterium]|nr:MAG: hypothetical protein Ct9H300mP1_27280 [Planctomycetaceae bacterium]
MTNWRQPTANRLQARGQVESGLLPVQQGLTDPIMLVAIRIWLTILVCCPAPAPPWCTIVPPIASQHGCRAGTTSSSHRS